MAEHLIEIDDMSCSHCVRAVNDALSAVQGLTVLGVAIGKARVSGGDDAVGHGVAALDRIGFPARVVPAFEPEPSEPRDPEDGSPMFGS